MRSRSRLIRPWPPCREVRRLPRLDEQDRVAPRVLWRGTADGAVELRNMVPVVHDDPYPAAVRTMDVGSPYGRLIQRLVLREPVLGRFGAWRFCHVDMRQ